jgi:hypothetical protein
VTEEELKEISKRQAAIVLAALRNNIRCCRCGWVGPEEKLYPSGSLARKTCPNCHDAYHWDRADPGRWFTAEDSLITCDSEKGCGDGTFYCGRRVAWLAKQGLDYRGHPKVEHPTDRPKKRNWFARFFS